MYGRCFPRFLMDKKSDWSEQLLWYWFPESFENCSLSPTYDICDVFTYAKSHLLKLREVDTSHVRDDHNKMSKLCI